MPQNTANLLTENEITEKLIELHKNDQQLIDNHTLWSRNNALMGCAGVVYDLMLIKARFFPDLSSVFQETVTHICQAVSPDHVVAWGFAFAFGTAIGCQLACIEDLEEAYHKQLQDNDLTRYRLTADPNHTEWFEHPLHIYETTPERHIKHRALKIG